jgi:uncharacterized phage-associated protein
MSYDGRTVANYFIELARREGEVLTHLKLQKLLYFAHGWHMIEVGSPLVEGGFEAWRYGPVSRDVYLAFRGSGGRGVDDLAPTDTPMLAMKKETRDFIEGFYDDYKGYTAAHLLEASHEPGSPWARVTDNGGDWMSKKKIPDVMIRNYFANDFPGDDEG